MRLDCGLVTQRRGKSYCLIVTNMVASIPVECVFHVPKTRSKIRRGLARAFTLPQKVHA